MPLSKPVKILVIGAIVTLVGALLYGMCFHMLSSGEPAISYSVKESKRRGVLVARLLPDENPVTITTPNDTITFPIYEAWIERHWNHGDWPTQTKIRELNGFYDYQVLISIPEEQWDTITSIQNLNGTWNIRIAPSEYISSTLGYGKYFLIGNLRRLPGNTLQCRVKPPKDPYSYPPLDSFTFRVIYEDKQEAGQPNGSGPTP